jgi:hypothetical protein
VLRLQVSDAVEIRLVPVESETGVLLYSPSDMPHPRGEIRRKAEGPLSLFPCPCPLDAPYLILNSHTLPRVCQVRSS